MSGFQRWVGKVAVVTGASGGIGAAITEKLVQEGVQVVGLARRVDQVQDLAKKLSSAKGKLHAVKCDVSVESELVKAIEWTKENVGPIHILINNAGVLPKNNLINGDTEKWRQTFEVNVIAMLVATREAIKVMKENNIDGHVININSVAGHYDIYNADVSVYAASKHCVTNLTETYRKEINANQLKIKVTSVSPGLTDTDMPTAAVKANNRPMLKADDIAEAVFYALSTKPHVQIHEILLRPVGDPV